MYTRAFTLVEMLLVIAIIGILTLIVIGPLWGGTAKARDARRVSDMEQYALAARLYAEQNSAFPSYASGIRIGEGASIDDLLEPFMRIVADPNGPGDDDYFYTYDSSYNCPLGGGTSIVIYGLLEREGGGNWSEICESDAPDGQYGIIIN